MKMKKEFNQQKYINEFNKENYSQFNVRLKKEEKEELDKLLKKAKISKSDFVRKEVKKMKEELNMLTSYDLLKEVVEMGFDRERALESIDMALDEALGYKNRKPLEKEVLSNELYNDILDGFKCEAEAKEEMKKWY